MITINLNHPAEGEFYFMPDGQPHYKNIRCMPKNDIKIICSLSSMNDVGKLLVCIDAMSRINANFVSLYIPYFLGARQDRMIEGEAVTASVIANLIPKVFKEIWVLHPHSNAIEHFIGPTFREADHTSFVQMAIEDYKPDFLIIPDLGAAKNATNYDKFNLPQLQCYKKRDTSTGKLSGFGYYGKLPEGKGLMVDDIGDGLGTFLGLAQEINRKMSLYVTHGIFSKRANCKQAASVFDKVYCTNSYSYSGFPVEICDSLTNLTVFEV